MLKEVNGGSMSLQDMIDTCLTSVKQRAFYKGYWNMFDVVEATEARLQDQAHRIRYQVYCKENEYFTEEGFCHTCTETDPFDKHAKHFLLMHKKLDHAVGTLRVLLPRAENPLTSFELQKYCDHPLLQLENRVMGMCEISRFCMSKSFRRRERDGNILPAYYEQEWIAAENPNMKKGLFRRHIPYAPLGLLKAAFEEILSHDITNCIALFESNHLKTLERLGIQYRVLGPRLPALGMQQPVIFNIKSTLDNMNNVNPECWDIVSDHGELQQMADRAYHYDWQDTMFNGDCRRMVLKQLL